MRVLRILPSLDPLFGGPSESASRSCIAAHRAGIETAVIIGLDPSSRDRTQPMIDSLRANGVTVHELGIAFGSFGRRNALVAGLNRKINSLRNHFDLIHLHSPWAASSIMTTARNRQAKLVMTPHEGFTYFDIRQSKLRHVKSLLLHGYARFLTGVVYASSLEATDSRLQGPTSFVVAHPVVDETTAQRPGDSDHAARRTVGYLGRLHPKKNIELCIRAIASMQNVKLVIAGEGPSEYRTALHRLADTTGAASRVDFVGFIEQNEKQSFFGAIDGLLLISEFECFGMAAAEALAMGVPVIVSRATGVSEVVDKYDCGLVTDGSIASLVHAIQQLLDAPRKPMIDRAYDAALAEFSFASHAKALGAAYLRCLTGR